MASYVCSRVLRLDKIPGDAANPTPPILISLLFPEVYYRTFGAGERVKAAQKGGYMHFSAKPMQ
jgi:hypothetical protein